MISARWLLSEDGQAFVEALALLVGGHADPPPRSDSGERPSGAGSAFAKVMDAYIGGVRHYEQLDPPAELGFRHRIHSLYWFRFQVGFDDPTFDFGLCLKQAKELGHLTAGVYRIHRYDQKFPGHDPEAVLGLDHLDWARDVLGFLMWMHADPATKRVRWKPPIDERQMAEQFDTGCTLC